MPFRQGGMELSEHKMLDCCSTLHSMPFMLLLQASIEAAICCYCPSLQHPQVSLDSEPFRIFLDTIDAESFKRGRDQVVDR